MNKSVYGAMTPDAIGIILRELARRAISVIRQKRFNFEINNKTYYDGESDDVFTSADNAAQEIYTKSLQECFPTFGVIAEEAGLRIDGTNLETYFTVDPLDGTRAFIRQQSHGIGTMIALVHNGVIITAVIGDINTQEIFYFRPESDKVWRIIPEGGVDCAHILENNPQRPLLDQHVLLRDNPLELSIGAQKLIQKELVFKNIGMADGSIGISAARLWKGEVGAHLLSSSFETPWDTCPVWGISDKLGYIALAIDPETGKLSECEFKPSKEIVRRDTEIIMVHKNYRKELLAL